MVHIVVPGSPDVECEYLVLDYNGTLAVDGVPLPGVLHRLSGLSEFLRVYILTADTFGNVRTSIQLPQVTVLIIEKSRQTEQKRDCVAQLGPEKTVAIGNGYNDHLMLQEAALGIAVMQTEGLCYTTLAHADVVFANILDAFDCLHNPKRLTATLRR